VRFDIGRALQRLCPGTQEVDHCLLRVATLAVVMRQHFGLRLDQPGKLCFQHPRNALVDLSSGAGEQRLVCGLAGEGMLEGVGGRGEPARLVEEFCGLEVLQVVVEGFVGQTGHRLEKRYWHVVADNCGGLEEVLPLDRSSARFPWPGCALAALG
jgi:hypothetical protein